MLHKIKIKALKKKTCSKFSKVIMYKTVYIIIYFVIIIVSYLALIRLFNANLLSPNQKKIHTILLY